MSRYCDKPLISLRGVSRSFWAGDEKVTALQDVNLDICAGEMVAIVGASGSGKSTLMNVLGCLDRPSSGTYRFAGRDVGELGPDEQARLRRVHFGFIFQRYQLLGDLDAVGNVEVPAIYAGEARNARRQRALRLLEQLGLADRTDHRPSELSGGQQQRVSIARALINGGEVVLADEPTGALDSRSSAELMELLLELNRQGHTIIIVTHDAGVAAQARRVIEISDGRIIADNGNAAEASSVKTAPARRSAFRMQAARMVEALRMALLAMLSHRLRSFLTMLGIIIGIASVVLVVALGAGSQEKVLENISSLGTNTISIRAGTGFGDRWSGRIRTLVPSDADALSQRPFSVGVSPEVSDNVSVRFGATEASASINGVSNDYFRLFAYQAIAGNLFDTSDINNLGQVAIIDEVTRDTFFTRGEYPIGQILHLGKVPVRVIGIVRSGGASFRPSSLNVWLPYTTVMSRVTGQKHLSSITVQVADTYDMTQAQNEINTLMLDRHGTQDFFLQNSDTIRQAITSTTQTMTLLIASIAVISLLVGGIGVMNIMLVSVTERTKEIGIRMAVGARRSDITAQFLIEAILICLVGGAFGIMTALGIGWLAETLGAGIRLNFSMTSIIAAVASSTLIGISFGFLPARSAAKLDPVIALSSE